MKGHQVRYRCQCVQSHSHNMVTTRLSFSVFSVACTILRLRKNNNNFYLSLTFTCTVHADIKLYSIPEDNPTLPGYYLAQSSIRQGNERIREFQYSCQRLLKIWTRYHSVIFKIIFYTPSHTRLAKGFSGCYDYQRKMKQRNAATTEQLVSFHTL